MPVSGASFGASLGDRCGHDVWIGPQGVAPGARRANNDHCCSAKCTLLHSTSALAHVPFTETMNVRFSLHGNV